jgi:signal transduction histidine kinase
MVGLASIFGAVYILGETFGWQSDDGWDQEVTYYEQNNGVRDIVNKWSNQTSDEKAVQQIDKFYQAHKTKNITVTLYDGEHMIYNEGVAVPEKYNGLISTAINTDENQILLSGKTMVTSVGKSKFKAIMVNNSYTAIYPDETFKMNNSYNRTALMLATIGVILMIVLVFVIINMFTRHVIKSITNPLDNLILGLKEVRAGNLDYCIHYDGHDEFSQVVGDFNEMTRNSRRMVAQRNRSDENRRELIAGISHDLRTPLTSIKAYVEGLEKGIAATPAMRQKYIQTIHQKTNDLEHIVSQLFMFTKLDLGEYPMQLEITNVKAYMAAYLSGVREEYQKKNLNVNFTDFPQVLVNVDRVQLRNVFMNILENTVKYGNQTDNQLVISGAATNHYVTLTFVDNGQGMASEAVTQLFEVFYRGDRARSNPSQGSGLGLAIAKKTIEAFNGTIEAQNSEKEAEGLQIIITLPLVKGDYYD